MKKLIILLLACMAVVGSVDACVEIGEGGTYTVDDRGCVE